MFQSGKKVITLHCWVCCCFKEKIQSSGNFSDKWISGANSLHTSKIRDHLKTNQHGQAIALLAKEYATARGDDPSTYASILQAMLTLSDTEKARLKYKFDIAYLQYSPLITSHTRGIFYVGHARLWCLPHSIAAWTMPAFRRGPRTRHFLLPATRGLATFIIKPCVSSSFLYMYNVIHCIHVHLTYSLCLAHTGWLWLQAFHRGNWRGGRFQLLMHTPVLYYCVFTYCTIIY